MRRRLRSQQHVREALLLDLGALVFELHRQGRREPDLLQAKAAELSAVDDEVRALSDALKVKSSVLEIVATGVAGSCGECGAIMSTDARYCASCGTPSRMALGGPAPDTGPEISGTGNGGAPAVDAAPEPSGLGEQAEPDEMSTEERAELSPGEVADADPAPGPPPGAEEPAPQAGQAPEGEGPASEQPTVQADPVPDPDAQSGPQSPVDPAATPPPVPEPEPAGGVAGPGEPQPRQGGLVGRVRRVLRGGG